MGGWSLGDGSAGANAELGVGAPESRIPPGVEIEEEVDESLWSGASAEPGGISALGLDTEMKEEGAVKESKKSDAGLVCPLSVKNLLRLGLGWHTSAPAILLGVTVSSPPPMLKLGDLMRVGWKPSGTKDLGWVPWLNMVHTGTGSSFGLVALVISGAASSLRLSDRLFTSPGETALVATSSGFSCEPPSSCSSTETLISPLGFPPPRSPPPPPRLHPGGNR